MSSTLLDLYKMAADDSDKHYGEDAAGVAALGGAGYAGKKTYDVMKQLKSKQDKLEFSKKRSKKYAAGLKENYEADLDNHLADMLDKKRKNRGLLQTVGEFFSGKGKKRKEQINSYKESAAKHMANADELFYEGRKGARDAKRLEKVVSKLNKNKYLLGGAAIGSAALGGGLLYDANRNRGNS